MTKFIFGNRKNTQSSDQQRYQNDVIFNRSPQKRYENLEDPSFKKSYDRNYDQHPYTSAMEHQQYNPDYSSHSFEPNSRTKRPERHNNDSYSDLPQLRAYTKQMATQDDVQALRFWQGHTEEEDDLQNEDKEEWAERSALLKFVIAIVGLFIIAVTSWLAYRWLIQTSSEEPPLIQAEQTPFKIRPENPGGTAIPHQDKLIYGRLTPNSEVPVERLLPNPDQPAFVPPPYGGVDLSNPQENYPPQHQVPPNNGYVSPPYDPNYPQNYGAAQPNAQGYGIHPQGQQPMEANPPQAPYYPPQNQTRNYRNGPYQDQEGYGYNNGRHPSQVPSSQPNAAYGVNAAQPYPNYNQQGPSSGKTPQNADPRYTQEPAQYNPHTPQPGVVNAGQNFYPSPQEIGQAAPSNINAERTRENITHNVPVPINNGKFYIQLATLEDKNKAKEEMQRISRKYAPILKGKEVSIHSIENSNGRTVQVVRAGPFNTMKEAASKCALVGINCKPVSSSN